MQAARRLLVVLLALAGVLASTPASAMAATDVRGTWSQVTHCTGGWCEGQDFPFTFAIGSQTGSRFSGGASGWVVAGTVSGRSLRFTEVSGSYVATFTATLSADGQRFTGSWTDTNSASGTIKATRKGSGAIAGRVFGRRCVEGVCEDVPMANVPVVASGPDGKADTTSGTLGEYRLENLAAGAYTVTVTPRAGMLSTPRKRSVKVERGEQGGVDFELCELVVPQGGPGPACEPRFDYKMPARFSKTGEPGNRGADVFAPDGFDVQLTVLEGGCDVGATYEWSVDGTIVQPVLARPCVWRLKLDEGTYSVRVRQTPSASDFGGAREHTEEVVVQDFLIASLGDSNASGEGNPPYVDGGALRSPCHRSRTAFGWRAALDLEDRDDRSSVTFVHLACTGASITSLGNDVQSQIRALEKLVGDREVDALHISVGINDIGFGTVLTTCTVDIRCQGSLVPLYPVGAPLVFLRTYVRNWSRDLRDRTYDLLRGQIRKAFPQDRLQPNDIFLTGYPDALHDERGKICTVITSAGPLGAFREDHGEGEVSWADVAVQQNLRRIQAGTSGWVFVPMPSTTFTNHGYCSSHSWFHQLPRKVRGLDVGGTLHPTAAGHKAMADVLVDAMAPKLLPGGKPRKPRPAKG